MIERASIIIWLFKARSVYQLCFGNFYLALSLLSRTVKPEKSTLF